MLDVLTGVPHSTELRCYNFSIFYTYWSSTLGGFCTWWFPPCLFSFSWLVFWDLFLSDKPTVTMQSVQEALVDDVHLSDRLVFLAIRDALESVLLVRLVGPLAARWRSIHCLHALARFYSLHTISILIRLVELSVILVTTADQSEVATKEFLSKTGHILVLGRKFCGRNYSPFVCRSPGAPNQFFWILHCIAAARGLVLIAFQLKAGARRNKHASKKLLCFPPKIQCVFRTMSKDDGMGFERLCLFLCMQFMIAYTPMVADMCSVYCLLGRSATYIGKSDHHRTGNLGSPLTRGVEHMFSIFFDKSGGAKDGKKMNAFKNETLADFAQFYLFSVPSDLAGLSERILIQATAASANTVHRRTADVQAKVRKRPAKNKRHDHQRNQFNNNTFPGNKPWFFAENPDQFQEKIPYSSLVNMSFRNAYFSVIRLVAKFGPLSIFSYPVLLTAYLSKPRHEFDAGDILRFVSVLTVFNAVQLVRSIRSKLFRAIATSRLNVLLDALGEAKIGRYIWHVPWPGRAADVQGILKKFWLIIGRGCRFRFRHIYSMVYIVQKRAVTYKTFFNMVSVARKMDGRVFVQEELAERQRAWSGKQFQQLKLYHKLRMPVDCGNVFHELAVAAQQFMSFARAGPGYLDFILYDLFSCCWRLSGTSTAHSFLGFSDCQNSQFVKPSVQQTLVAEDKDPAAAWLMPTNDYCRCLVHLLEREVDKWELTSLSVEEVWEFKRQCFQLVVDEGFGPKRNKHVLPNTLPYLYATVKAKCFISGKRTCVHPSHSCMRKIVSYALLEASWKRLFRKISRATMVLVMRLGFGDEIGSLALTASTMRRRYRDLVMPAQPLRSCVRCHVHKCPLELLVADAGAMYEAIDSQPVLTCLEFFTGLAKELGYVGVAVFRTKKLHG